MIDGYLHWTNYVDTCVFNKCLHNGSRLELVEESISMMVVFEDENCPWCVVWLWICGRVDLRLMMIEINSILWLCKGDGCQVLLLCDSDGCQDYEKAITVRRVMPMAP